MAFSKVDPRLGVEVYPQISPWRACCSPLHSSLGVETPSSTKRVGSHWWMDGWMNTWIGGVGYILAGSDPASGRLLPPCAGSRRRPRLLGAGCPGEEIRGSCVETHSQPGEGWRSRTSVP